MTTRTARAAKPNRKPTLSLPTSLPTLPGFHFGPAIPNPLATIFAPERDPLTVGGEWFETWLPRTCKPTPSRWSSRPPMTPQQEIERVARELGQRAALSMELRTGIRHLPDGLTRAYQRYAHELLDVPMEVTTRRESGQGLTLRCWNTARMKRDAIAAERARIASAIVEEGSGQLAIAMPE